MKKLLLTAMLLAMTNCLNAQEKDEKFKLEKGTWALTGKFSLGSDRTTFDSAPDNESTRFNLNILPSAEYFISDNLSIGLGLAYNYNESEFESSSTNNVNINNLYSVSSYIKKYVSVSKKLSFSLQGGLGYTYTDSKYISSQNDPSGSISNRYNITFRPGITYLITDNLAFEANLGRLGYSQQNSRNKSSSDKAYEDSFDFDLKATNILFGLTFYL